jgi:hypothetical protein
VTMSHNLRSSAFERGLSDTIFRSMSSDMQRVRRWDRHRAVPPLNTRRNGFTKLLVDLPK